MRRPPPARFVPVPVPVPALWCLLVRGTLMSRHAPILRRHSPRFLAAVGRKPLRPRPQPLPPTRCHLRRCRNDARTALMTGDAPESVRSGTPARRPFMNIARPRDEPRGQERLTPGLRAAPARRDACWRTPDVQPPRGVCSECLGSLKVTIGDGNGNGNGIGDEGVSRCLTHPHRRPSSNAGAVVASSSSRRRSWRPARPHRRRPDAVSAGATSPVRWHGVPAVASTSRYRARHSAKDSWDLVSDVLVDRVERVDVVLAGEADGLALRLPTLAVRPIRWT